MNDTRSVEKKQILVLVVEVEGDAFLEKADIICPFIVEEQRPHSLHSRVQCPHGRHARDPEAATA